MHIVIKFRSQYLYGIGKKFKGEMCKKIGLEGFNAFSLGNNEGEITLMKKSNVTRVV